MNPRLKKFSIALLQGLFLLLLLSPGLAKAALTVSSSPADSIGMESKTVSGTAQNSTGTVSVTVNDDREGSPGWTLNVTASHITLIRPAIKTSGTNDTVTSAGTYDGTLPGNSPPIKKYTLAIAQGGPVGTATFDVSGEETAANITTGSFVAIGTKGVRANFDVATYQAGNEWTIPIDSLPYTDMTVSPGNITVNSGSGTNVMAGASIQLIGSGVRSDSKLVMQATAGYGTGNYTIVVDLSLSIHPYCLAGNYSGDIIFTLS